MIGNPALTKHGKELAILHVSDGRELEFQKSRLVRVYIDAVNGCRFAEKIVERVTTGACDCYDPIVWADSQCDAIDVGIFPALVVYQIPFVNLVEEPAFHSDTLSGEV